MKKNNIKLLLILCIGIGSFIGLQNTIFAATAPIPNIQFNIGTAKAPNEASQSLQMLFVLTILALAPSILIMMTAFTRIIISLHFLKSAIGTQQMPPNQIVIGLALFLTFFVMSPVFTQVKTVAIEPYQQGLITQQQAIEKGIIPVKEFMVKQTRNEDMKLFMDIAGREPIKDEANMLKELPLQVVIPAFIISELRAGFIIGFLIYIPFIVIDMVIASTLMAMGMMMLPPAMISLPFKILLFVLVDGWNLIIGQLIQTFK